MTIGGRIRKIRKENKKNLDDFGKAIGITGAMVSMMENGKAAVIDRTVKSICREYGVREEWLRTGQGPMMVERPRDEALAAELEKVLTAGAGDFRRKMISVLVQMPPEWWNELEKKARELSEEARPTADMNAN